jgi:hypothetical protein
MSEGFELLDLRFAIWHGLSCTFLYSVVLELSQFCKNPSRPELNPNRKSKIQ